MLANTEPPQDRRVIVISGPSGVGKGTLINKLKKAHPNTFALAVSNTTRSPRPGEEHGVAYHFIKEEEFLSLVVQDAFIEHAVFGGNHYGTSKQTVLDQSANGRVVILDIELEGVKSIKADPNMDARFVFIEPPSFAVLEARLRGRGSEKEESIQKRLKQAKVELEQAKQTGFYDKVIVNDNVEKAVAELDAFVYGTPDQYLHSFH